MCSPAFDYARQPHEIEMGPDGRSALFHVSNQQFVLNSTHPLRREQNAVIAEFTVEGAEQAVFALRLCDGRADRVMMEEPLDGETLLNQTVRFWGAWAAQSRYHGRWREIVMRSALVLKPSSSKASRTTFQKKSASLGHHVNELPRAFDQLRII